MTRSHVLAGAVAITACSNASFPEPAYAQAHRDARHVASRGAVVAAYYRPVFYDPFFYDPWFPYRFGWYPPYAYPPYGYGQFYGRERVAAAPGLAARGRGVHWRLLRRHRGQLRRALSADASSSLESTRSRCICQAIRTVTQKILLQPGGTFRIRHMMEPLPAGAAPEPRPVPPPVRRPRRSRPLGPRTGGTTAGGAGNATFGAIAIRVQPADADVLINGERWEGAAADEALVVQMAPGVYRSRSAEGRLPDLHDADRGATRTSRAREHEPAAAVEETP